MKTTLSVLLAAAGGAGVVAGTWYARRGGGSAASDARTILYYVDPMHPADTSGTPGTAPDCGMALQPVYSDRALAVDRRPVGVPGPIAISSERQQLIGVRVSPVASAATSETLRLYGRVAADENTVHRVDVGIDGFVR